MPNRHPPAKTATRCARGSSSGQVFVHLKDGYLRPWPSDRCFPMPDPESEMDSVMCRLMSDPCAPLDVQFNGTLLRIFEAFLHQRDQKAVLEQTIDGLADEQQALIRGFQEEQKSWQAERQEYKGEIKRLELRLVRASARGLAEVTLARQESRIRPRKTVDREKKETIFEVLDRAMYREEAAWNSQRGTGSDESVLLMVLIHDSDDAGHAIELSSENEAASIRKQKINDEHPGGATFWFTLQREQTHGTRGHRLWESRAHSRYDRAPSTRCSFRYVFLFP